MTKGKEMEQTVGTPGTWSSMATKGTGMEQTVGSPGTWSSMALRVSQCVLAAASLCVMVAAVGFSNEHPAFNYFRLVPLATVLQTTWSLGLACLDIYAIRNRKNLHERWLVYILATGDLITTLLSGAAASASTAVASLLVDVNFCSMPTVKDQHLCTLCTKVACDQVVISIVLAFIASFLAFCTFLLHVETTRK